MPHALQFLLVPSLSRAQTAGKRASPCGPSVDHRVIHCAFGMWRWAISLQRIFPSLGNFIFFLSQAWHLKAPKIPGSPEKCSPRLFLPSLSVSLTYTKCILFIVFIFLTAQEAGVRMGTNKKEAMGNLAAVGLWGGPLSGRGCWKEKREKGKRVVRERRGARAGK